MNWHSDCFSGGIGGLLVAEAAQNDWTQFAPFVALPVLLYLIVIRPAQQDSKRRDDFLKQLKKNDRVVTSGGILGQVANISQDGKEVTLKVDDNTRIRFLRESIVRVLVDESAQTESSSQAKSS